MISTSYSLLSSTSPFPSSSSSSYYYTLKCPKRNPKFHKPISHQTLKISATFANQFAIEDDDVSAEKFTKKNSIADFMRFKSDGAGGDGVLQTAVVSYKKKFPWSLLQPFFQVDLVSTIHIGDKEYFDTLQKVLEPYDSVLYEMVASKESLENRKNSGTKILKSSSRSRGFNIIGCIQRQMASVLTLDFQLDCLDYEAQNFYHADLDFETFKLLQIEKGESFYTFARDMTIKSTKAMVMSASIPEDLGFWRSKLLWASRTLPMPLLGLLIIGGVCADGESSESEYSELEALSRLDIGSAMKIFLAKRLTTEFSQVMLDEEEESVIIGERNKAAIEALHRAIDKGQNKIAILYGGGHMPDLGRRLREEFDLIPSSVQWVSAWSIKKQDLKGSSIPFLEKMAEISGWPLNRYQTFALLIFSSVLAVDLLFWELFFDTTVNWISEVSSEAFQFLDSTKMI